jgi:uncharacterized membrane protein
MVDPLIGGVLNWIHVISAIGWLGASMLFGMVLGPLFPSLAPARRTELILKFYPKFARYMTVLGLSTAVFGAALAFAMAGGDFSVFSASNQWGLSIMIGATLALVVTALAFGTIIPSMNKTVRLLKELQRNPSAGPSPELPKLQSRMKGAAFLGLLLLMLVVVFMVAAAWAPAT